MPLSSHAWRSLCAFSLFSLSEILAGATPVISQQPRAAAVVAGQTASFSVTATGATALTYQWRRDGFAIPGATASFFVLPASSQGDAGVYDVRIGDGQIVDSDGAMLRVSPIRQPEDVTLDLGKIAALETTDGGNISSVAVLPDGRFYVLGSFVSIDNQPRDGLARFSSDGTLDRTFSPPALDGEIHVMAAQSDGRVVIAGEFTTVNGVQSVGLARLKEDGSLDPTFAVGSGFSAPPNPPTLRFYHIAIAADGAVVLGGSFRQYQDSPATPFVKITNSGAPDRTFSAAPVNITSSSQLVLAPDGKIYATNVTYTSGNGARNAPLVLRFLPNGSIDPAFDAGPNPGSVSTLFRQADGKILVGYFATINGIYRQNLVRLNESGAVDPTFNLTLTANVDIVAIDQFPNGDLLLGGSFGSKINRVKSDGTLDRTFTPPSYSHVDIARVLPNGRILIGGGNIGPSIVMRQPGVELLDVSGRRLTQVSGLRYTASVRMMGLQPGGKLIVAGDFTHWNGTPTPRITRLNADLTPDPGFRIGSGPNGLIITGTIQPDGKIVLVGLFTQINGVSAGGIARLNADGSLDTSFRGSAVGAFYYSSPPAILRDGRILLPTHFDPPRFRGFYLYNPDGSIPATDGFGNGIGNVGIRSLETAAVLPNGQILIGGSFETWSGQNKPHLARLNSDGSIDASWSIDSSKVPEIFSFDSLNRVLQSTGDVVVRTPNNQLIRLKQNGTVDSTFNVSASGISDFRYLIQSDDRLLTWGSQNDFTPYMRRLTANGGVDSTFHVIGSENKVGKRPLFWNSALIMDSGDIVASSQGIFARYAQVTIPVVTSQPKSITASAGGTTTFRVAAAGPGPLAYQWLFNGEPITGATGVTYTVPLVLPALAGKYSVTVTNASGTTNSSVATLSVDSSMSSTARLSNASVRSRLGGAPLIVGFTVAAGNRNLLIRSVGPTLGQFGVTGAAADPRLTVFQGAALVQQNDNWGGAAGLVTAAAAVSAFPFPATSLDAALVSDVQGSYSGHFDAATSSGVVLAEIYDVSPDRTAPGRLTNLSARYRVGTGEDILIAGFSVSGGGVKGVLLRGIGPSLTQFGVSGVLSDPQLAVFSGVQQIAENNDWRGSAALVASTGSVGAFPLPATSLDSALVIYVPAGSYTVQLSGVNGTTGEGLIEIYELP